MDGRHQRGELVIPPRAKDISSIRVGVPAVIKSRLPEDILKKEIKVFQGNNQPMALPTIPIMETVSAKPAKISQSDLIKPINRTLVDGSFKQLKDIKNRQLLKLKDKEDSRQTLSKPNKQLLSIDKEPPTKSVSLSQSKNRSSKIKRHKQSILKQLPVLLVLVVFGGLISYVSYDFWGSNLAKNQQKTAVLGVGTSLGAISPKKLLINNTDHIDVILDDIDLKSNRVEPGRAYYQQGVLLVDYESLASKLDGNSLVIVEDKAKGELLYSFKSSWIVDNISGLSMVWPANNQLSVIAYNQTLENWLIISLQSKN